MPVEQITLDLRTRILPIGTVGIRESLVQLRFQRFSFMQVPQRMLAVLTPVNAAMLLVISESACLF